jgi:ABC-type transport system involved in multi-copper enzyme maturation permease subunit
MFRGSLTLLARSLRLDARQRRAHGFRFGSVAVVFWLLVAAHFNTGGVSAPGLEFYRLTSMLCFGLITIAGAGLFSSAITEEKEAGTLNLLLLANVSPIAILVGKSTTRLVSALLIFAGIFPFTLLALALGGMTIHQIWSGTVALAAYLVFVANLGVLSSVLCRTTGRASVITTLVLLLMCVFPFFGPGLQKALVGAGWIASGGWVTGSMESLAQTLEGISPITRLDQILQTGFDETAWSQQVFADLFLGAMCFGLAWVAFPIFCERMQEDAPSRAGVAQVRSGRRSLWRLIVPRPWKNPLVWKDFHFIVGGLTGLLTRGVVIALMGVGSVSAASVIRGVLSLTPVESFRTGLALLVGLEVLSIASQIFHSEYKRGTLCTLAMLPRSTLSICYSKACGCALAFLPAAIGLAVSFIRFPFHVSGADEFIIIQRVLIGACLLAGLAHLTALFSLAVKWGALPLAIGLLMVLSSCATPFVAAASSLSRIVSGEGQATIVPVLYLTLLICAALQLAIGIRFRSAAAE